VKPGRGFLHRGALAPVGMAVLIAVPLLIAVVLLPGCGPGTKSYTDFTYGFGFSYPNQWSVEPGTSEVTAGGSIAVNVGVYDPGGTKAGDTYLDLVSVTVYNLSFTVDDPWSPALQNEMEGLIADLESRTTDVEVERDLSHITVAELNGYTITYTFTMHGTPMRSTLYFLFDGDREYQLTQQASLATWDTVKPLFDDIVESFRPGKVG